MVSMENDSLLSIGCAAVEAGVSVARMQQALDEVRAAPAVTLNHVPHYCAADVERAIEHVRGAVGVPANIETRSAMPAASRPVRRN